MLRVAFMTLGCKVNYYETERMQQQFEEAGYMVVAFEEAADIYIINTCTVTNIADRKSRKMLHRARRRNPEALIVAAGCYADSAAKKGEADESVDLFVPNFEKAEIEARVSALLRARDYHEEQGTVCIGSCHMTAEAMAQRHTRAYLKVQDGCNQYCSYCIIPYVRGALKSRKEDDVVREVEKLAAEGIREVVVTGIHLSSYGVDFSGEKSFVELGGKPLLSLIQAIAGVEGIERIRLGSLEPRIIKEEFIRGLAGIRKLCPQFHLSLQSGCDEVLRRMNRHYTAEDYLERLRLLRSSFDNPAVTTDIIVGFPQETDGEFDETCAFAEQAEFARIHVFKYSRRIGTMADSMEGQIDEEAKAGRSEVLLKIAAGLEQKYQNAFLGKRESVLFEEIVQINGQKYLAGYNERYVRIGVPEEQFRDAAALCNTIGNVSVSGRITQEVMLGRSEQ